MALTASRLQSIVAKETTRRKLIDKINLYAKKQNQIFPDILQNIFFPHGECFEDQALQTLFNDTNIGKTLKGIKCQKPFMNNNQFYLNFYKSLVRLEEYELPEKVLRTIYSQDIQCFASPIGARPDAITVDYIIEVKCPFGGLRHKIPIHYIAQMMMEMFVSKKRSALFVDYYDPRGWRSFVLYIVSLYKHPPQRGQRVFRNDVDTRRPPERVIQNVLDNIQDDYTLDDWQRAFGKIRLDNIEMHHILQLTKGDLLAAAEIMHFLQEGRGIRGGQCVQTYYDHVDVQWDRNQHIVSVPHTRFRRQLVQVLLNIEPLLQKIPDTWRRWFKMVKMNMTIPVHTPDDVIYPELIVYKLTWSDYIWSSIITLIRDIDSIQQKAITLKECWKTLQETRHMLSFMPYKIVEHKTFQKYKKITDHS